MTDHLDAPVNVMDRFRLPGRVAVVTGAGKGIGAAIALALADAGADVAIAARTESDLDDVAERIHERGQRALVFRADLNDERVLAELIDQAAGELGSLDILVNNAGGSTSYPFLDTRIEHLESSFHFNVSVPFELSRLAVPHMLRRGSGSIINIASVAGTKVTRGGLVHGTMKAALGHMTRLMSQDLAPRVRVNAVLPGAIETATLERLLSRLDPGVRQAMIDRTPMRRNGLPSDIAPAVVYLASDAACWVTGKLLEVDGNAAPDLVPKSIPDL